MTLHRTSSLSSGLVAVLVIGLTWSLSAQQSRPGAPAAQSTVPTVSPAALRTMLPALDGWTSTRVTAERMDRDAECTYAFAEGVYVNGDAKIRVTVADTAMTPDALMALASLVKTLPEGYTGTVPPTTSVERLTYKAFPAAAMWDSGKGEGEFTVLVNGRFVAKAEAVRADSLQTLRTALDSIDLTQFASLK